MSLVDTLRRELADTQTRARAIIEAEDRTDAADANLTELLAEGERIEARIAELVRLDSLTAAAATLDGIATGAQTRAAQAQNQRTTEESAGAIFTRSEAFTNYRGRGQSGIIEVDERALPMTLGTLADGLPRAQRIDVTAPDIVGPLLGLIGTVNVSSNAVEAVVWEKVSGGAAIVPEGQMKPPVEWEPSVTPFSLDTIAAYTQLTRQLMEDATAVRSFIDGQLRREVVRKLESEAGAAIAGATVPTASGATLLAGIRQGIAAVQAAGFRPDAVLLNPSDYADVDLEVMGATVNGPVIGGRFWGLTPVPSIDQPIGTALVGDFSAGVQRYVRSGVSLYVTDSHADTFLRNVFTLLAEARAKTVVTRPDALVKVTVGAKAAATK